MEVVNNSAASVVETEVKDTKRVPLLCKLRMPVAMALCMSLMCLSAFAADGDPETATTTIASLLSSIGSVFTQAMTWVGSVASTVASQPILLLACVGVPLCGLGVGMFGRLIHSRV